MIKDHRRGRQVLKALILSVNVLILAIAAAALAVVGPAGSAVAQEPAGASSMSLHGMDMNVAMDSVAMDSVAVDSVASTTGTDDAGSSVSLETEESVLTAADKDLVVKVRLAGLWEVPAGKMAMEKGVEPRVREIGQMIATQHVRLDELDRTAAKQLGVALPNKPTAEQRRWLDEMTDAEGAAFDDVFTQRLRAAHGKIFPAIAVVRASTENTTVRKLAQSANAFVLTHLTLLESTGLVRYEELPKVAAPATGPVAAASRRSADGGIAVPVIWLILAASLIFGVVATSRMVRPSGFGGRPGRGFSLFRSGSEDEADTGLLPVPPSNRYPNSVQGLRPVQGIREGPIQRERNGPRSFV